MACVTFVLFTKYTHIDYDPQEVSLAKIEEVLDDTGYRVAK
jgi:hypothetical protein